MTTFTWAIEPKRVSPPPDVFLRCMQFFRCIRVVWMQYENMYHVRYRNSWLEVSRIIRTSDALQFSVLSKKAPACDSPSSELYRRQAISQPNSTTASFSYRHRNRSQYIDSSWFAYVRDHRFWLLTAHYEIVSGDTLDTDLIPTGMFSDHKILILIRKSQIDRNYFLTFRLLDHCFVSRHTSMNEIIGGIHYSYFLSSCL